MKNDNNTYRFFESLVYDVTEDYRTNNGKEYDINKTIENLFNSDELWQQLTDAVWENLVEKKEGE